MDWTICFLVASVGLNIVLLVVVRRKNRENQALLDELGSLRTDRRSTFEFRR